MKKINVLITPLPGCRSCGLSGTRFGNLSGPCHKTDINRCRSPLLRHKHQYRSLTRIVIHSDHRSICDVEDVSLVIPTIDDDCRFSASAFTLRSVGSECRYPRAHRMICMTSTRLPLLRENGIPVRKPHLGTDILHGSSTIPSL